jgi:hypothetical protein
MLHWWVSKIDDFHFWINLFPKLVYCRSEWFSMTYSYGTTNSTESWCGSRSQTLGNISWPIFQHVIYAYNMYWYNITHIRVRAGNNLRQPSDMLKFKIETPTKYVLDCLQHLSFRFLHPVVFNNENILHFSVFHTHEKSKFMIQCASQFRYAQHVKLDWVNND